MVVRAGLAQQTLFTLCVQLSLVRMRTPLGLAKHATPLEAMYWPHTQPPFNVVEKTELLVVCFVQGH